VVRRFVLCCAALFAGAPSEAGVAQSKLLQSVEIEGMSTDGGEGKLYRATKPALAPCRMDVMLWGESGRAGWTFMFGSRLVSATSTEYRYNRPYYMKGGGRVGSTHSITLASAKDRKQLQADFADFKAKFDPRKLAQCETN
jgi:hypothetical protein